MKILFLDIDGVLNCTEVDDKKPFADERMYGLNPELVKNLKKVVDATGCKIVVSSSWRHINDYAPFRPKCRWRGVLANMLGYEPLGLFIGDTPKSSSGKRGEEILEWLESAVDYPSGLPLLSSPQKICVVDDEISDITPYIDEKYVVKTDMRNGLTESDADRIIGILNG
jgi:hypothetical protein